MKKIIITGANGFIGYKTISFLKIRGYEIHALTSRNNYSVLEDGVNWHKINLFDSISLEKTISDIKPSHMLHFAWTTKPGEYQSSEENLYWVKCSIDLLHLFHKNGGKRFVLAGTCAQYDLDYGYLTENKTPSNPSSLYGVCKCSFENIAVKFCKDNNLSFASGRVFFVYGDREKEERLVPYIINGLLKNQIVRCSQSNLIRDYMYIEDVANAFVCVLDSETQGVVNIGSGNPLKLEDLVMIIGESLNKNSLIILGELNESYNEPNIIVANNSKLRNETNWIQEYDIKLGIEKSILWWRRRLRDE